MKTLELFADDANKSLSTVKGWIKKGLVNGAAYVDGEYQISDLARPPYTHARNKNAASIRKGIVAGCKRRLSVNARVFKISEYEFAVYADQVIALGLIEKREVDGVTYYFATPKADDLTEAQAFKLLKELTEAALSGSAGATAEKKLAKV